MDDRVMIDRHPDPWRSPVVVVLLACAILATLTIGYWPLRLAGIGQLPDTGDDAFYYFIIAKNLAATGRSTFDGQVLTNGYHPLWQMLLTLQYATLGDSMRVTIASQVAAVAIAIFIFLRIVGHWTWSLLFAFVLASALRWSALIGMETAILLLAFAAFTLILHKAHGDAGVSWLALGLSGGVVIAARLDAALFVLPALVLVPLGGVRQAKALSFIVVGGVIYAFGNWLVFDSWMPISGSIKSLGGLQLNRPLLHQLARPWDPSLPLTLAILSYCRYLSGQTAVAFLCGIFLLAIGGGRQKGFAWSFLLAMLAGTLAFALKLVFFSGWVLWPWYYFPLAMLVAAELLMVSEVIDDPAATRRVRLLAGLVCAVLASLVIGPLLIPLFVAWLVLFALSFRLEQRHGQYMRRAVTVAAGLYVAADVATGTLGERPSPDPYLLASRGMAGDIRSAIGNVHVAMGDRSGAFAYFYGNPVTQLEGITNDAEYLRAILRHQPLKALLCRRGVRYIVQFEPDLGAYAGHDVAVFNPNVTSVSGPSVAVTKSDEVLRLADPTMIRLFPENPYVYVWRLSGCSIE